jgi:hypothetical protein
MIVPHQKVVFHNCAGEDDAGCDGATEVECARDMGEFKHHWLRKACVAR